MNKTIFFDNFVPDSKNPNKHINVHQRAFGDVSIGFRLEYGYFCKLNTGFYAFRYPHYADSSPYGWMDFHEKITSVHTTKSADYRKLKEFDLECRYLIGIHKNNLRPIFNNGDFSRELTRQENNQLTSYLNEFSEKYQKLFERFKFENELELLYSDLEDYGITL